MTQDEHESERNDPGRNKKKKKKKKNGKVGEAEVNEKIGETSRISRCRNKTNNVSLSKWYRGHRETNTS